MLLRMSRQGLNSIYVRLRANIGELGALEVLTNRTARRFLRLHKWIDNFNAAAAAMSSSKSSVPKTFETAKFSFFGLYFLMEMFTITDVMGLTNLEIGPWLVVESNRMWFIGLIFSVLQAIWEGLFAAAEGDRQRQLVSEKGKKGKKEATGKMAISSGSQKAGLPYKQIISDCCDMTIPGSVIQVIPFSPFVVGLAMALSTVLQLSDMWPKVQAQAAAQKK